MRQQWIVRTVAIMWASVPGFVQPARAQCEVGVTACLADLGFIPESLAACGMTPSELDAAMQRVAGADAERVMLCQARADLSGASESRSHAIERYQADPEDSQAVVDYQHAEATITSAAGAIATVRGTLWDLLTAELDQQRLDRLACIVGSSKFNVPAAYRCVPWSPRELRDLQSALLRESVVLRDGGELSDEYALLLSRVRQLPQVITARSDVGLNMDAMQQVFQSWADGS